MTSHPAVTDTLNFSFEAHQIRTIVKDGNPWFVAADVCSALKLSNPTKSVAALDDDEKALTSIQGLSRGNEQANIISESGLYFLTIRCRDAVKQGTLPYRFRKWVTAEVLPAIRKTGKYAPSESSEPAISYALTDRTLISRIGGKLVAADDISLTAMVIEPSQVASLISEPFFSIKDVSEIAAAAVNRLSELSSRAVSRR